MADFEFNNVRGRLVNYALLGLANDALLVVVLEQSGLPADSAMRPLTDLAAIFTAGATEHPSMTRQVLTGVSVTVDNTHNCVDVDAVDPVWLTATGLTTGALLICTDLDTTSGTDANIIPLLKFDFVVNLNGGNISYQFPGADGSGGAGFYRA